MGRFPRLQNTNVGDGFSVPEIVVHCTQTVGAIINRPKHSTYEYIKIEGGLLPSLLYSEICDLSHFKIVVEISFKVCYYTVVR